MRTCSIDGCELFGRTRHMCDMHYQREVRAGKFSSCKFEDCSSGIVSAGMCEKHYRRELRARKSEGPVCTVSKCERRATGKGWCSVHYSLYSRYKIDPQRYEDIVSEQNGVCAICLGPAKLHMDHNHDTGEIRGALCGNCNRAIGLLRDDFNVTYRAAIYLEKWKGE